MIGSRAVMIHALTWWGDELGSLLPTPLRRFFGGERRQLAIAPGAAPERIPEDVELILRLPAERALARSHTLPAGAAADLPAALAFELERQTPFRALDELRAVIGFPPAILAELRRFATAHSQLRGFDPREAAPELVKRIPLEQAYTRSHRIAYRVLSEARLPSGARFRRDAVLWLTPGEAAPFARLAWGDGR